MKILVVGSGGREHALAWKLAQSPRIQRIYVAPGNGGTASDDRLLNVPITDPKVLVEFAARENIHLTVVGPEAPLAAGIVNLFRSRGLKIFGPTREAAQLESSKDFAKAFMQRHGIPTAEYQTFSDAAAAHAYIDAKGAPIVVKADGLAAGKGVAISPDRADAEAEIERMLGGRFGAAGSRVVIEEFMDGEEGSLFALSDGTRAVLFGGAQDHKRAFDGDLGPNTGGMGAYSPAPVFTAAFTDAANERVVVPTIRKMAEEGVPYRGVLYVGLMATAEGPKVVEFNARFGDPECQVLMMRLDGDVVPLLLACARGDLTQAPAPVFKPGVVICVVLAAKGYPDSPLEGSVIRGADQDFGPHVQVFHAGTKLRDDGALAAAGGRVLNVCAYGEDVAQARERAYEAIAKIDWPGGFHRTDIGWRALEPR